LFPAPWRALSPSGLLPSSPFRFLTDTWQGFSFRIWDGLPDKVEAAYRRGDMREKRRNLMEAWASFCSTPKAGKTMQFSGKAR
jgi:hypothetical protein